MGKFEISFLEQAPDVAVWSADDGWTVLDFLEAAEETEKLNPHVSAYIIDMSKSKLLPVNVVSGMGAFFREREYRRTCLVGASSGIKVMANVVHRVLPSICIDFAPSMEAARAIIAAA